MEGVAMLDRAVTIVAKQAGSALLQQQATPKNVQDLLQSLSVVLDAAAFSSNDQKKLAELLQSKDSDEDGEFGAPASAGYADHSGGIVDMLEDMKDKAETQLQDARKAESNAKHNFAMLKQSLEDQIDADTSEKS